MAIYRSVQLAFWTDNKVEDDFTPEDKYFYLYLLTNPQTNICGCYEVSYSQLTNQTGYNKDTVNRLLDRFEKVHELIRFNKKTKEILILNWYKYNWSRSEKVISGVENVAKYIKCEAFRNYIFELAESIRNNEEDTPCIPYTYPMETSVSDTVTVNSNNNTSIYKEIIDYLNSKLNTKYQYKSKNTQKHINARLSEGRTLDDFKIVIDKKVAEWKGTEMERYLCPDTLFGTKFEKYLNQNIVERVKSDKPAYMANNPFLKHQQSDTDYAALEKELLNI